MPDILTRIGDVLDDWENGPDSHAWTAVGTFPDLDYYDMLTARDLAAVTGLDGYTTVLVVGDVAEWGDTSPFAPMLDPVMAWRERWHPVPRHDSMPGPEVFYAFAESLSRAMRPAVEAVAGFGRMFQQIAEGISLTFSCSIYSDGFATLLHAVDVAERPRWHRRRCPTCNPRGFASYGGPPWTDHYRRMRARARRRRRRHGRR